MKNLFFLLLASTLIFTACDKDDDCDSGSLETAIVGRWDVRVLGLDVGDIEFKANGDLVDDGEFFIDNELPTGTGETVKTYDVKNNTTVTVRAENDTNFEEYDVDIDSYNCDEIQLTAFGQAAVLRRK